MVVRRRRHRWTARVAGLVALLVLPAAAGVLALTRADPEPDSTDGLVRSLVSAGETSEIIDCVLRLAERDLRSGPLETEAEAELVANCRIAREALAPDSTWEPPLALADAVEPIGLGDDPVLDRLWLACEDGSGEACDRLFASAPVNSAYETFGLTCGDRPDVLDCAELDVVAGEADPNSP